MVKAFQKVCFTWKENEGKHSSSVVLFIISPANAGDAGDADLIPGSGRSP